MTPEQAQAFQTARWKNAHPALLVGHVPETDDYVRLRTNSAGELISTATVEFPSGALNVVVESSPSDPVYVQGLGDTPFEDGETDPDMVVVTGSPVNLDSAAIRGIVLYAPESNTGPVSWGIGTSGSCAKNELFPKGIMSMSVSDSGLFWIDAENSGDGVFVTRLT